MQGKRDSIARRGTVRCCQHLTPLLVAGFSTLPLRGRSTGSPLSGGICGEALGGGHGNAPAELADIPPPAAG